MLHSIQRSFVNFLAPAATWRRGFHLGPLCCKSGHYKITPKKDRPLTYEQSNPPYRIGVTKGWNSWNASTLRDPQRQPCSAAYDDEFIRKFVRGTWQKTLMSDVVIKRRHREIVIAMMVCPLPSVAAMHFLTSYTETLLSHLFKALVRVELQAVRGKNNVIFKYI
ncbi:hypothetical protein EMCRGX_G026082 [Ephydatia muelleri]